MGTTCYCWSLVHLLWWWLSLAAGGRCGPAGFQVTRSKAICAGALIIDGLLASDLPTCGVRGIL